MKKIKVKLRRKDKKNHPFSLKKYKKINRKKIKFKRKKSIYSVIIIIFLIIVSIISFAILFKKSKTILFIKKNLEMILKDKNSTVNEKNLFKIMDKYKRENEIFPIQNQFKYRPLMSNKDFEAFLSLMNPKNIYFEFGSGGTTYIASYYNLTVYSVESDVKWHEKLKRNGIKANFITVDLKSRGNFGNPGPRTTVEDWKKYIQAYKSEYNADIILIDGRFRVACALDIFQKIRSDTLILIHDYTNRDYYHLIENYYLKIKSWDTLAAFVKKPNINLIPEEIYNKYLYITKL